MTISRRTFVATTSAALTATLPRRPGRAAGHRRPGAGTLPGGFQGLGRALGAQALRDPQVKALVLSAVDAAKQAGANYADVRLTHTKHRNFSAVSGYYDDETLGLSVRALVDGYWGWAATPYVAVTEAPRVAQAAVGLAKGMAGSQQLRRVELAAIPVVSDGMWSSPIQQDPFEIAIPQLQDWVIGLHDYIPHAGNARGFPYTEPTRFFDPGLLDVVVTLEQQERVFASTEGSYCTQTVTITDPHVGFIYRKQPVVLPIRPAQRGYEYIADTPWPELIRQAMDRIDDLVAHSLPNKLLDIGRYDIVFSAKAMAQLVGTTFGTAAQVDRALGYEANATGTSYLGPDPLTLLGTPVASPLVTVTADRSQPQALGTIQWDDEGVHPADFTLVQKGALVDYQTTREQAAWLAPWYQKQGRPVRSHGCAAGPDALAIAMQHTPNLTLQPGTEGLGLEELVASLEHGLVVESLSNIDMDFQAASGFALLGRAMEVRHGKRVAQAKAGSALLFRTPELWKGVTALGGSQSLEALYPLTSAKGEPEQTVSYSVAAVPARVKQLSVINARRKA